jgi:hypothetical protein
MVNFFRARARLSAFGVRREEAALSSGCKAHPATAPARSNRSSHEVTKWLKPSISVSRIGDSASVQAATRVNAEQASHDEGLVKGSHHGDIERSPVASVSKGPSPFARRGPGLGKLMVAVRQQPEPGAFHCGALRSRCHFRFLSFHPVHRPSSDAECFSRFEDSRPGR